MANIIGTPGDETLFGTNGSDNIKALEGNDVIKAKNGHDKIFADIKDVWLGFEAESNDMPTVITDPYDQEFGDDKVWAGKGNDKAYGDARDFEIVLNGASNVADGVDASLTVGDLNVEFGSDHIYGEKGHDMIFGDVDLFRVELNSGTGAGLLTNASVNLGLDGIDGIDVVFGHDNLYGGKGNDKIFGDARDLEYDLNAGGFGPGSRQSAVTFESADGATGIVMGDDLLEGGKGHDELYGDVQSFVVENTNLPDGTRNTAGMFDQVNFGNDELWGGEGNDKLYGDAHDWTMHLETAGDVTAPEGGDLGISNANKAVSPAYFGDDNLNGSNGKDQLFGDLEIMEFTMISGPNYGDQTLDINTPGSIFFGDDTLDGGKHNDEIYGDVNKIDMFYRGGDDLQDGAIAASINDIATWTFGNDQAWGGHGNDKMVGDAGEILMDTKAGDRAEGGLDELNGIPGLSGTDHFGSITTFGNDTFDGGDGHDEIIGDVEKFFMEFRGGRDTIGKGDFAATGAAIAATAGFGLYQQDYLPFFGPSDVIYGDDVLDGGKGHDAIYGDGKEFEMWAISGTGTTTDAEQLVDVRAGMADSFIFGADKIYGGEGDDELFGDYKTIELFLKDGEVTGPGTGIAEATPGSMIFGDDVIDGGDGNDWIVGDVKELFVQRTDIDGKVIGSNEDITFGNDDLKGGKGHDVIFADTGDIWLGFESQSNTSPTIFSEPFNRTFGNDVAHGGDGDDKIYGDARDLDIQVKGADDVPGVADIPDADLDGDGFLNAHTIVGDLNIAFGNDTLDGGAGHDEIYGDLENFFLEVQSGKNGGLGADSAAFIGTDIGFVFGSPSSIPSENGLNLKFGDDELTGGDGDDKIYGDTKGFEHRLASGGDDVASQGAFSFAYVNQITTEGTLTPIKFGDDMLDGGKGNDELYGDAEWFEMNFSAGANGSHNAAQTAQPIHLGNDVLHGGDGEDLLVGDVASQEVSMKAGDNNAGPGNQDADAQYNGELLMGEDELHGGKGSDHMYGDSISVTWDFAGGDNLTGSFFTDADAAINPVDFFYPDTRYQFGADDMLYGNEGNDHIFGDVSDIEIKLKGGDNTGGTIAGNAFAIAIAEANLLFGSDIIDGGKGNDELIGDAGTIHMDFQGGNDADGGAIASLTTSLAGLLRDSITFGDDQMSGGDGHDWMVGDVQTFNMDFRAGVDANANALDNVTSSAGIGLVGNILGDNEMIFGNDIMDGGKGHDTLFGEGEQFNLTATAGTALNPSADPTGLIDVSAGIQSPVIFGDDTLTGGKGDDELFGDYDKLEVILMDGDGPDDPTVLKDADLESIKFGDDIIDGGDGHDWIVGDSTDVWFEHKDFDGNDLGDSFVEDIDVTWGNDVLTGGAGDDTFFFELQSLEGEGKAEIFMQMQGDDVITDLDAWDTIEFDDLLERSGGGGPVDLADLDDHTIFSDVGTDLNIAFSGGGSLTLTGYGSMGITTFDELETASGANVVV